MEPGRPLTYPLLLLVALIIGSLVTHMVLYNQYQKSQETAYNKIQTLNITINRASDNIDSIASRLEQLDNKYNNLNDKVYTLDYSLNVLENSIEYLGHRIDLFEEKYEQLVQENEDGIQQIKSLEEHVEKLYRELGVTEGYKLYLDHDIYFQYPKNMTLTEKGLRAKDATTLQGLISGSTVKDEYCQYFVTDWEYDIFDYYQSNLLTELNSMQDILRDVENLQVSEDKTTSHLGHTVYYRDFSGTINNVDISGRMCIWFCEVKKRAHAIFLWEYGEEGPASFNFILESYRCHR
jgi:archaellum component FlaC